MYLRNFSCNSRSNCTRMLWRGGEWDTQGNETEWCSYKGGASQVDT
jgi:hypothetical protein